MGSYLFLAGFSALFGPGFVVRFHLIDAAKFTVGDGDGAFQRAEIARHGGVVINLGSVVVTAHNPSGSSSVLPGAGSGSGSLSSSQSHGIQPPQSGQVARDGSPLICSMVQPIGSEGSSCKNAADIKFQRRRTLEM